MLRDLHIIQREMLQHFEKMRLPGTKNNFEKRKNVFGSRSDFLPFFIPPMMSRFCTILQRVLAPSALVFMIQSNITVNITPF